MIMSIVRHPIRAKYADEWPELAAEFTTATLPSPATSASIGFAASTTPTSTCWSRCSETGPQATPT